MKVVISAGGTGGHIYPALAIIKKIKEMEIDSTFLYIGTTDRMEKDIVPKLGISYVGIEMKGLNRKNLLANFKAIACFNKGIKICKKKIKEFNPDVVLGIGGYITAPVIYAAKKMGYKTFIHEQNSIPGFSNKFLSKYADKIGVSLPGSLKYFDKDKTILTGNPRSEEVLKIRALDKKSLGLSVSKKLVIIVMGSLGSSIMNKKMKELLPNFKNKNYEVLFITGKEYYEDYSNIKVPSNVKILPFMDNLLGIMKKCDLIVSRAGASIISEITSLGLPSILIPSPYVTHNHQYKNAKELEDKKATIIIEEENFNSDTLITNIDKVLNDKSLYNLLRDNTKKLGISDSATKIYKIIRELADDK